jgi:hypothetical protein
MKFQRQEPMDLVAAAEPRVEMLPVASALAAAPES